MFRRLGLVIFLVSTVSLGIVKAGSGTIPVANINGLRVHWEVQCPEGNIGGVRAYVDNEANTVYELSTGVADFDINPAQVSNGHHNLIVQVRCGTENWGDATTSTIGFDWYAEPSPAPVIEPTSVTIQEPTMEQPTVPPSDGQATSTSVPVEPQPTSEFPEIPATLVDGISTLEPTIVTQPTQEPAVPLVGYSEPPLGDWVRVLIDVNIRDGAGKSNNLIAVANAGTYFDFFAEENGWVLIGWGNGTGYGYTLGGSDRLTRGYGSNEEPIQPTEVPTGVIEAPTDVPIELTQVPEEPTLVPAEPEPTVIRATSISGPKYPQAQLPMGGVDVYQFCIAGGKWDAADHSDGTGSAYSWRCRKDQEVWYLDWNIVCMDVYGPGYYKSLGSPDDLGGWKCVTDPNAYVAPNGGDWPELRTADGGVDTVGVCKKIGYDTAQHSDTGADVAYSHRCVRNQETREFNWDDACFRVYGADFHKQLNSADEVGGWKCVTDPNAYVDPPDGIDPRAATLTPVPPPTSVPVTPNNGGGSGPGGGCPPPMAARLNNGGQAQTLTTIQAYKQNLFSGAITNELTGTIPSGSMVNVVNGPICSQSANWWLVSYSSVLGWASEGTNDIYYLEPYQSSQLPKRTIYDVSVVLEDGSRFTFQYDAERHWILNASQFVTSELAKVQVRMNGKGLNEQRLIFFVYALPTLWDKLGKIVEGEAEANKRIINATFCGDDSNCINRLFYILGGRSMDVSGVGNIAYGYFMDGLGFSLRWQDRAAIIDQLVKSLFSGEGLVFSDNYDDMQQRVVGRELRNRGLTKENLDAIAEELGIY